MMTLYTSLGTVGDSLIGSHESVSEVGLVVNQSIRNLAIMFTQMHSLINIQNMILFLFLFHYNTKIIFS